MRRLRVSWETVLVLGCVAVGVVPLGLAQTDSTPAGSALPGVSQAGNGPGSTAGSIEIELKVASDIPIRLTDVSAEPDRAPATESGSSNRMMRFHYKVENASAQRLVAFEVRWETYAGGARVTALANDDDRWLDEPLSPGESEGFQVSNVYDSSRRPIERLVGSLTYAEFENGVRLGSDAKRVSRQVTEARRASLKDYAKLLSTYQTAGEDRLLKNLRNFASSGDPDPGVQQVSQRVASRLLLLYDQQGLSALLAELERVANLQPPE